MIKDELPSGWEAIKLEDIASWGSGGTPPRKNPRFYGGDIPWIKTGELGDGLILDTEEKITDEGLKNSSAKVFPIGSIAIAMYGATIGKVSILGIDAATNQACAVGIPDLRLTGPQYIFQYLRSQKEAFIAAGKGGAQPNLSQGVIKEWPLPLAPLAEQKRIADKLEAVLGRVDACRARLDHVPALLKRFRQSVLASATSGKLTEHWREETNTAEGEAKTLGQVVKVSSGKALTAKNMAAEGSIPVFGGNGINGYHDEGNVIEETLVIGRVGYYCGCVHMTPQVAWVTDNALIVRHDATESSKRYLFYALQALDLRTNDAATAQPVISGQKIYSLLLTLPTLPEQQEIVRRVEDLFAFADRIEARLATAQKTVERLTPATLAKAFRGELVPQDPNDEPASALLERLNSAATGAETPKKRKAGGSRTSASKS